MRIRKPRMEPLEPQLFISQLFLSRKKQSTSWNDFSIQEENSLFCIPSVQISTLFFSPGVLVVPDLGCGAYGNDAVEVGRLLGEALRGHSFLEIHLVGQASFADATESTAKGLR